MRQSQLFTKTRREAPTDEVAKNAQLLIRAGFINKEMAGVYDYLPLGLRVLNNINTVIRKEMDALGAAELTLTALQDAELWKKTDRWEQDVWFKTSLNAGGEVGLGWTQEEAVTRLAAQHVHSYRDLPFATYQIQTKFRNEERAKSGIMRGREFLMKDLYSFHASQADLDAFYDQVAEAYARVFERVGLGSLTYKTFASGGAFAKYSHEFQTLAEAGEDTVYLARDQRVAVNEEVLQDEVLTDLGLSRDALEEHTAVEVGNIFKLGTRFSEPLGLTYKDDTGAEVPVVMGCYGMGPSRLMGTIVEVLSDEKGIVWPKEVAPYAVHIVSIAGSGEQVTEAAGQLYEELTQRGVAVLYDDRDLRAGEKLTDTDLIGIPLRVVVSEKSLQAGGYEVTERASGETSVVPEHALLQRIDE